MACIQRFARALLLGLLVPLLAAGCESAPITGRDQLVLISEPQAAQMGIDAYQQILTSKTVVKDGSFAQQVVRVGRRIARAVGGSETSWEFNVIEDGTPNAFALPGGKVGVHTGLARVAKTEDQLAAVMAHEIAHVTARHSAERMSQQMLVEGGIAGITQATGTQSLSQVAALAATLGLVLPFTRTQESEADEIGLHYMARAGYDPRAAVELWRNFDRLGGERPPEFLSTHPSPGDRIARLQQLLPKVMPTYQSSRRPAP